MKRDPISYVECSLPEGITLAEYRRARWAARPTRRGVLGRMARSVVSATRAR